MSSDPTNTENHDCISPIASTVLSVVDVDFGGNASEGKAFYSFLPKIFDITEASQKVSIVLSGSTPSDYKIRDFFSSDAFGQIKKVKIEPDGKTVTFTHLNTHQCVTSLLIEVCDSKGNIIYCDPQAINRPPN